MERINMCAGGAILIIPPTFNPSTAALRYRRGVGILKGGLNENTTDAELLEERHIQGLKGNQDIPLLLAFIHLSIVSPPPVCQWWRK